MATGMKRIEDVRGGSLIVIPPMYGYTLADHRIAVVPREQYSEDTNVVIMLLDGYALSIENDTLVQVIEFEAGELLK